MIREALALDGGQSVGRAYRGNRRRPTSSWISAISTLPATAEARPLIENAIAIWPQARLPFIALGGDHSITYPILRGLRARRIAQLTILQIDAHPDLYDEFEGDRYSHACPFARIMEERTRRPARPGRHSRDDGARARSGAPLRRRADRHARVGRRRASRRSTGDVYVSIDLDGLDPAFAPGVSHREPGGLTRARSAHAASTRSSGELVGADIVEFNPTTGYRRPDGACRGEVREGAGGAVTSVESD